MKPFALPRFVSQIAFPFAVRAFMLPGILISIVTVLTSCNDTGWPDRDPVVVDSLGADALGVWPPLDYALPGDTLTVEVSRLKTLYVCARLLTLNWVVADSGTRQFRSVEASAEMPGTPECALTPGLDTVLSTTAPAAGRSLMLRTPSGTVTDSLFVFAGGSTPVELVLPPTDTVFTFPGFRFRDSTAGHPRRALYADSLAACEVVQAAVFSRLNGDTLSVRFRLLKAEPALSPAVLPACAGPHVDTVIAVPDRYGYR